MGLSRQVDVSGSFARTPRHILVLLDGGVGANASTLADGPLVAANSTGPLAWQLSASQPAGRTDVALPGARWRDKCLPLAASCGNASVHMVSACVRGRIKPYKVVKTHGAEQYCM